MPQLRDLELGANPAAAVPEYKHCLVLQLPSLQQLDGDALTQLDKDIAEEYYAAPAPSGQPHQRSQGADVLVLEGGHSSTDVAGPGSGTVAAEAGPGAAAGTRPGSQGAVSADLHSQEAQRAERLASAAAASTSQSAVGSSREGLPGLHRPGTALQRPGTALMRPGTAGPRPGTPGGFTSQLVSDDLLNDNPVLLEYLAKYVLAEGFQVAGQVSARCEGVLLV